MAPLIYFNSTPLRGGVSVSDHSSFTSAGSVWSPQKKTVLEDRKAAMLKKMEKTRRATMVKSEHRTASLRMHLDEDKEDIDVTHHLDVEHKKRAAGHHTHGHKMLAELILNDEEAERAGHQFKFNPNHGQNHDPNGPSSPGHGRDGKNTKKRVS